MISDKLCAALNKQINAEMYSSYLYLSMSAWFEDRSLSGFGNWMRVQAEEETFHAMKMFDYVIERGGRVVLESIQQPESEWESPLSVIEAVLKHEELVTGLINDLVEAALAAQAVRFLASCGHERIAALHGPLADSDRTRARR